MATENAINKTRRELIIEYVKKNPECFKENVIDFVTKKEMGSRVTIRKTINELRNDGILNVLKEKKNSRAYKLTIVSENLLLTIPQDLDELLLRFKIFVNAVKELCVSSQIPFNKSDGNIPESIEREKIAKHTIPLLYFTLEIIHEVYSIFLRFVLPEKLDRKDQIVKLYMIYYQYIGQMYSLIIEEIGEYIPEFDSNLSNRSIPYATQIINSVGTITNKTVLLINTCNEYSLRRELFDILHFIWQKNVDIAYDQYTFGGRDIPYEVEDTGKIDKSYLEIEDPKLRAIYRAINFNIDYENRMWQELSKSSFKVKESKSKKSKS
jgi:hypothetical protein